MPTIEYSDRLRRYREHRLNLTAFVNHRALNPKYSMFAELILLWLDAKPDSEAKTWMIIMMFMGVAPRRKAVSSEEELTELTEDNAIDKAAKEEMKGYINAFLSEDDDEVSNKPSGS